MYTKNAKIFHCTTIASRRYINLSLNFSSNLTARKYLIFYNIFKRSLYVMSDLVKSPINYLNKKQHFKHKKFMKITTAMQLKNILTEKLSPAERYKKCEIIKISITFL